MSRRRPKLEFCVAGGAKLQQPIVAAVVQLEACDRLRVAAIEAFRQPQHRGEAPDRAAALLVEVFVVLVAAFRRRLTGIASDKRDRLDFLRVEAAQVAVLDEVIRVFVMAFVADVDADVVKDARVFEPLAFVVGHPVHASRLIEQHRGQTGDLLGVLGPVVAALRELEHAAPADVGIAIGLGDLLSMARDVVEDESFAE